MWIIDTNCQKWRFWTSLPYLSLLIWTLPLLIFSSGHHSLMAHDEGLYAWRARLMWDSGDWINPWSNPHHKTPGFYWLIAVSYTLFNISEFSVRFPSAIAAILSTILLYDIGKIILNPTIGWLAAAILNVEFLWLQYSRLGTPDVTMVFLILLAIWCILKAELNPQNRVYSLIAGLSFGLGFLVRSFMIILPLLALLPYLWQYRRKHHLTPMLYVGILVGLIPTLVWLLLSFLRFGDDSWGELINFVLRLGSRDRSDNGWEFYFWNVALKAFPWSFLSLIGLFKLIRHPHRRYQLLLVGFPLIFFTEITIFSTRLSHYSLALYPFIALLAAIGLNWLVHNILSSSRKLLSPHHPRTLSYTFGLLAVLLLIASTVILIWGNEEIRKYATMGLALGLGWLILPVVWITRDRFRSQIAARLWLAGWLIPTWLALAVAGCNGLLSDYNPDVRVFLEQRAIAQVLQNHPINFVQIGGKTAVLLKFYTPHHGQRVQQVSELPLNSYAWIPNAGDGSYKVLGTVQKYRLIQVTGQ